MGELHRIGLEVEVERDVFELEPTEWELDDLMRALSGGAARAVRVVRGRVSDEQTDPLSTMLDDFAADLDSVLQLHWLGSSSPDALLAPASDAPRSSLETLVELRELEAHARRLAERLRAERL
ncbi:MAG TPA: hypothetical protein VGO86_05385 [Candidatus Dormibacteraeota bacterium]